MKKEKCLNKNDEPLKESNKIMKGKSQENKKLNDSWKEIGNMVRSNKMWKAKEKRILTKAAERIEAQRQDIYHS